MNAKLFSTMLAVAVALSASLTGACSSQNPKPSDEPAETQASGGEEATTEQDTLAEGPDVEGETEEQALVLQREQLAEEFVRTWCTTVTVDPYDDTKAENIPDWFERCLTYVRPNSQLYAEFMKRDEWQGPGVIDAATIAKDVKVVSHDGDTYVVAVEMAGTQTGEAGWTKKTYERLHVVTFDGDNNVVRLDTWG